MKGSVGIEVTHFTMLFYTKFLYAPPNSLKDSNMNSKMKIMKEKRIGVRFLIRNILGVKKAH
jgi:hypothetical protein